MKKISTKIVVIFLFSIIYGCNPVKRIPENSFLLRKNTILVNNEVEKSEKVSGYILQHPNARVVGIPLGLSIYNLANPKSKENYEKWLEEHPKTHRFLNGFLSKKQVARLGESFIINGKDKMLMSLGEAPVVLDTAQTHKSMRTLVAYYKSNGYFNATGRYDIEPIYNKKQQTTVIYNVNTGDAYFIDSLSRNISSPELDSVYVAHINKQILKKGQQYSLNKFAEERNRLNTLFRNNGFYTFQQSSINFEIERDTTLAGGDRTIFVKTTIEDNIDRSGETPVKKPHLIHKLGKINLYTDYDLNNSAPYDTIQYKDITIHFRNKSRFRRKMLYNSISLRKDDIYKDDNRTITYRQLSNLRMFRYPNIQYTYSEKDSLNRTLDANVFLTPLPRYALELNSELTHSNIQAFGVGLGTSFLARNIFRGAEILELGFRGTIGSQQLAADTRFFNVFEYGGDVRLTIPRVWFFLNTDKIIPHSMTPQTILQFGATYQKNIGLDRNKLQGVLRYVWHPTLKNRAVLELIDAEYINNLNPDNYFNVYESSYNTLNKIAKRHNVNASLVDSNNNLTNPEGATLFGLGFIAGMYPNYTEEEYSQAVSVIERLYRLTKNDLILASSFSYTFNNSSQYSAVDFQQLRLKLEIAGNAPQLLAQILDTPTDNNGQRQFLGVTYAQYVKTEFEYIKHWNLSKNNVLAFRVFSGIAIPYGNGKNIPFSRSYFAGGSNDNRGWRAYSLGPGHSQSPLDFNEANFKFTTNIEYRFPIKGAFKGALFADAGNIWNVFDDVEATDRKLDKISDIQDVALATGMGLRYDFNYFVLRFDLGFKTYDPAQDFGNRWIKKIKISESVFNIGINYPF